MNLKQTISNLLFMLVCGFSGVTYAGNTNTCLQGLVFTNYGASSPSYLRQCFQSKFTPTEATIAANTAGYHLVSDQEHTSIYKSDGSWLMFIKNRSGASVSEVILIMDQGL